MTSQPRLRATQVSVDSRLMQNYRLGSPLPTGTDRGTLATAAGSDGTLQLFSIGTNGHVYNIVPDAASETGWSSLDMGTAADHQAVEVVGGTDPDGVMFAAAIGANDNNPFSIDKIRATRWNSTWQTVYTEGDPLSKLRTGYGIGGAIEYATGGSHIKSVWGPVPFDFDYPNTSPDVILDWAIGKVSSGLCCMVSLNMPGDGVETFKVWTGASFGTPAGYVNKIVSRIALTPIVDSNGLSAVFLLSADDNGAYAVTSDLSIDQEATTVKISGSVPMAEIAASSDADGLLELFALGTDHYLYHARQDPRQPGGWGTMVPISQDRQFGQLAAGRNAQGVSEVFAVASDHTLHRFWRDPATTNWMREEIEVGSTGALETLHTYTTDLTVLDATRAICPNTTVTVSSLDPTPALINGRSYWIDETAPAVVTSDAMGKVTVVVETAFLDAPVLQFATEFMTDDDYIHVQPNASIQDTFSTISADVLMNPKNPDGKDVVLLKGAYHTPETAGAVADALAQCGMLLGDGGTPSSPARARYLAPGSARRGVVCANRHDARSPRQIDLATVPDQHWEIDYSSGFPVFRTLTRETALRRIADVTGGLPDVRGLFGFDVELGDVLNMATQTVTQIADVIVTTVTQNGIVRSIQLAIELVINEIKWRFEGLVDLVDQAFDLARSVLAKIEATIDDLLNWLENLFKWDDILRTKEALKYTINETFTLAIASVSCFGRSANDFFDALKLRAHGSIQQASNMDGIKGRTLQQLQQAAPPMPPEVAPSMQYNVVATAFYNDASGGAAPSAALALTPETTAALQDFVDVLIREAQQFQASDDFQQVVSYFQQMVAQLEDNPQAAMQSALSGFLALAAVVAEVALDVAKAIVNALVQAIVAAASAFQSYLTAEWDNEFLIGLYRFATGDPKATLSVLDLLCLMLAIPATVLYKAIAQAPPFPDETSLETYQQRLGARVSRAVQVLGPGVAPPLEAELLPAAPPSWFIVALTFGWVPYGFACALADSGVVSGFGEEGTLMETGGSLAAIIGELLIFGVTTPWIYSSDAPAPGTGTAAATASLAWAYSGVTAFVDIGSFMWLSPSSQTKVPTKKKLSLQGDIGTALSLVEGVGYVVLFAILARESDHDDPAYVPTTVANFATALPYLLRFVRFTPIEKTLPGRIGKYALVVLDVALYIMADALYIDSYSGPSQPAPAPANIP